MSEKTIAQTFGRWGEAQAADYLQHLGYTILVRNWRTKFGEIDIIAKHGRTIYFFEVKSRSSRRYGEPHEAVTWFKRRQIMRAAQAYVQQQKLRQKYAMQFGVIGYVHGQFTIWPNWDF